MAICNKCKKILNNDDYLEAKKHFHKLDFWLCFDCLDKQWRKEAKQSEIKVESFFNN